MFLKLLRLTVTVLTTISICVFAAFFISEQLRDKTIPVITVENEIIDVSLHADDKELLAGVTAYDKKDGDITSKIIVESVSKFTEEKTSIVTYAVCDNDNHVATAKRKIRFKDYTEPYFVIKEALVFAVDEQNVDIISKIGAMDCIDGDISNRVIITASDFETNTVGVFTVSAKATNSMGDSIYMDIPVYVEEKSVAAPKLELKSYLVKTKVGENIDLSTYITSATDENGDLLENIIIDTNFDPNKPGRYQAHYYTSDSKDREGHSILTIIVEG